DGESHQFPSDTVLRETVFLRSPCRGRGKTGPPYRDCPTFRFWAGRTIRFLYTRGFALMRPPAEKVIAATHPVLVQGETPARPDELPVKDPVLPRFSESQATRMRQCVAAPFG